MRKEVDLAKAELTEKGKTAGKGAGMFGGAGLFGLTAFLALTACLIALLSTAMRGVARRADRDRGLRGGGGRAGSDRARRKLKEATPPAPEQTIETLKEDVQWAKNQKPSGAR